MKTKPKRVYKGWAVIFRDIWMRNYEGIKRARVFSTKKECCKVYPENRTVKVLITLLPNKRSKIKK